MNIEDKRMKVMHIIHGFPIGGAEVLVKEYCSYIDRNKFDIVVLCFDRYDTQLEKCVLELPIKIHFISDYYKYSFSRKGKLMMLVERLFIAKRIVRKEKPDIIHSHLTLNYLVRFCKPSKSTLLIHTVHNEPKVMWKKTFSRQMDLYAAKWLVKRYKQRFIALHDSMRLEINRLFSVHNTIVLNNGIDFSKFVISNEKSLIRERLQIPQEAFVIGNIGRFEKQKNHTFLIDVFNEIYKKNNNAYLLLVGAGLLHSEIVNKIKSLGLEAQCKILSNRTDIPEILEAMDIFCFPSQFEGLGIVLIEAQKMGVKCVTSDKIPSAAIVSNQIVQLSLNEIPTEWARYILNFNGEEIRYFNIEEWDIKNVVKRLENIYENKI